MVYHVLTDLDIDSLTEFKRRLEEMGFLHFEKDSYINYKASHPMANDPSRGVRRAFTIDTETKSFTALSTWEGDFITVDEFLQHYYGEFYGLKFGMN